jgi:hypothetical protein
MPIQTAVIAMNASLLSQVSLQDMRQIRRAELVKKPSFPYFIPLFCYLQDGKPKNRESFSLKFCFFD